MTMNDFERRRKRLCDRMAEKSRANGEEVITRVVHFTNDDVPNFLRRLDKAQREMEEAMKHSRIRVKGPAYGTHSRDPVYNA